jgi:hypothetical protein
MKQNFWKGVFSEPDGTPSFSRVATGFLVCFAAGWVTHLVWHNHALPEFAGLALFIGTLYSANQIRNGWGGPKPPVAPTG